MSKRKNSPTYYKLLIPGLFLAILGLGNIILGNLKYNQYQQTYLENTRELGNLSKDSEELSPLERLKVTQRSSSRIESLVKKAKVRRDLYNLVTYAGKIFTLLGIIFLTGAVLKKHFEDSTT